MCEHTSRHHRKSKANKGKSNKENISIVCQCKHMAWHRLFNGRLTVLEIAKIINETWIDGDYELVVRRRR